MAADFAFSEALLAFLALVNNLSFELRPRPAISLKREPKSQNEDQVAPTAGEEDLRGIGEALSC